MNFLFLILDEPLHEFDRRMTEKIQSQRPFDEL